MKGKINYYWIIAGIINLLTAFIHTFLGQTDVVNPLLSSNLTLQTKAEWLGVWHMITLFLFSTTFFILFCSFKMKNDQFLIFMNYIGYLYIVFSFPFIISGIYFALLAPQWLLLLPIGGFIVFGSYKLSA